MKGVLFNDKKMIGGNFEGKKILKVFWENQLVWPNDVSSVNLKLGTALLGLVKFIPTYDMTISAYRAFGNKINYGTWTTIAFITDADGNVIYVGNYSTAKHVGSLYNIDECYEHIASFTTNVELKSGVTYWLTLPTNLYDEYPTFYYDENAVDGVCKEIYITNDAWKLQQKTVGSTVNLASITDANNAYYIEFDEVTE